MSIDDFINIKKKPLTLKDRAALYNSTFYPFSKTAPLVATQRWLYGFWMMGNNYRKKTEYYGAYPHSYLKRVFALFPDCRKILHVFSGTLDKTVPGKKVDINPERNPDYIGDAKELSLFVKEKYSLLIADPPYSAADAEHYGTIMINRKKVVSECAKVLRPGGFLVWLDQVLPMFRKKELHLVGIISVIISTNHRTRCTFIWQKPRRREITSF